MADVTEARKVFDRYDANKSGSIDAKELGKVLSALGLSMSTAEVAQALKELDTDASGQLSWDEFESFVTPLLG